MKPSSGMMSKRSGNKGTSSSKWKENYKIQKSPAWAPPSGVSHPANPGIRTTTTTAKRSGQTHTWPKRLSGLGDKLGLPSHLQISEHSNRLTRLHAHFCIFHMLLKYLLWVDTSSFKKLSPFSAFSRRFLSHTNKAATDLLGLHWIDRFIV